MTLERGSARVQAEIEAGGVRVPYLRAGLGPPALLVRADPSPLDPFLDELARTFRVHLLLAAPPLFRGEAEIWLRQVVEGLGLAEPDLFADAVLASVLSRLVTRNVGFVGRVTFLSRAPAKGSADGEPGPH